MINSGEGDTHLSLKQLTPVRLLKNDFFNLVQQAENKGASTDELQKLLGRGRAKLGMFEGNLAEGELEIGQVSALLSDILPAGQVSAIIKAIKPAAEIVQEMYKEYEAALKQPVK